MARNNYLGITGSTTWEGCSVSWKMVWRAGRSAGIGVPVPTGEVSASDIQPDGVAR